MMARAEEFGNIHSGLSSLSADGWEGRAADHFRSKFKVQIQGWVDAQEAFSSASEAYSSYASTLASAQSQCDGIRVRWEQGRNAVQQAQNNQADARSQAAADGGSPVFDASCDEGPGRSAMAAAVADFQTLVDQVNEAGDLLITALNAGIAKLPERTWWDSVKRTVGSILGGAFEAVVEVLKLVWKLGGGEGMWDFGRVLMGDMTLDEYNIKHKEIPAETLAAMAKALWNDPVGFMTAVGKSLIDWDTWTDDPGRAIGHLLPDVVLALATMGGSAGVSAGEKALTGTARALRIGKEVFKAILPISPDDVRSLAKLGKNLVGKLSARGIDTAADLADLANTAQHLAGAADHAHDAAHAAGGMAGALDGAGDAGRAARTGSAIGDTSHAAHAAGGAADAAGSASHAAHGASGGGGIASGASSASHAANGAGSASHAAHAGGNTADAASNTSHATHAGGNTADAAGNASHASHGGADVKDSALPPTDPGHRSNGVSSAAQPAATPHASAAGDASTGGHAAPANTAPSASNGAHNNAFMNADTGGTTHGAGSTANGATGAPATGAGTHGAPGAGTHGAPATGAPATGTHGAPATSAPAPGAGTHGAGTTGAPATGAPATGAPAAGTHGAGSTTNGATSTPDVPTTPPKKRSFEELLGGGDKQHTANGTPDAPTTPKKEQTFEELLGGGDKQHTANGTPDAPTHADEAADASKAGHGSGDASGSGKADTDAKHGHDSAEHADADPKAKDHSANGKADDAADSAHHGDKTEADKPTSDKSHKEDDAAHHDGDEHPKDTDDKHTTKNDDADTKSPKDEADTHKSDKDADGKSDKDSVEHADAESKAKDHSANDKADDAADSTRHGDKTEADKPTSDKTHKEDNAAHHDGDEHSDGSHDGTTDSQSDLFPDDYPANTFKDDADPDIGSHDSDFVKEHPESKEPPTTVDELAERSPKRPLNDKDELDTKMEGIGDRYQTGKDITLDHNGQLKNGSHPEMESTADWATSRYARENGVPNWRQGIDHGAVPGSDRYYTNLHELAEDFHITGLDRTGNTGGDFLAPIIDDVIIPAEYRSTPPSNINEPYRQLKFTDEPLPEGWRAEISIAASDHGSLGGSPQIRILAPDDEGAPRAVSIHELIRHKPPLLEGVSDHVGTVQRPDFHALQELFNHARGARE